MNDVNVAEILYEQHQLSNSLASRMNVESEINPDDMLFDFLVRSVFPTDHPRAIEAYFNGGADCAQRFATLCREHLESEPKNILEFASGYGRVTRHIKKLFPNTLWTCSDVHQKAVDFTHGTLGVDAFLSPTRPEDLTITHRFDVVFALSFFSHMPRETFGRWLECLLNAVAPGGILVFTTHGTISVRNMKLGGLDGDFDERGFFWDTHSDQRDLDSRDYGTSAVTLAYVARALKSSPIADLIRFQQAFWWNHQDLYVVRNAGGHNGPKGCGGITIKHDQPEKGIHKDLEIGMRMPMENWLDLNKSLCFERPELSKYVSPFPPPHLMQNVSGLTSEVDFAAHGVTIYRAIQDANPKPLADYRSILDFGCGCGRLARMFKGHPGKVTGCDIDARHIDWINGHLPYMVAVRTAPAAPLPFESDSFDGVISVSVFSHLDERTQKLYLAELARVSTRGAELFLTTHGERALERAINDDRIFEMLGIFSADLERAKGSMLEGRHSFILQPTGHLTTDHYKYGITFIPQSYIRQVWTEFFDVGAVIKGAIYDFQDIVVCRKR
jgi:SAM-dependent methyltransferase